MLNGGTLDGAHVVVTSDTVTDEHEARPPTAEGHDATIEQHDKPKAGIVAEILAKGYVLSEQILHKAIEIDQKQARGFSDNQVIGLIIPIQGISTRFINYIRGLDSTVGAQIGGPDTTVSSKAKEVIAEGQARAHTIDEQHGISRQATDYYTRAIQSDFGQKVVAFYTQAAKQAQDVHEEAKRIAQLSKEKAPGGAAPESSTGSQA